MNLSGMKSTISLADIGDQNGLGTLESHAVEELPNFDTLISRNDNQNGETSMPHNAANSPLDEDQLPPPPPLPPMQWRMMRQTTSLEEGRGTSAKDMLRKVSSLPHVHTSDQDEHLPPIAPPDPHGHIKEMDVQKTEGVQDISNPSTILEIKSSLLQQIGDKVCSALLLEKSAMLFFVSLYSCYFSVRENSLQESNSGPPSDL
uniref:Uncharacterized protein n=1 Tax=Arundo donax TaxID=35708 RepID=A0A0A9DNM7_ARUDO